MAYIVAGMIIRNEEQLIRYSLGSIYDKVDEIVVIDAFSTDRTLEYVKEIDVDKKIRLIQNKWPEDYAKQRNIYLEYIKKNIYPKHRSDLYYLRVDADEVYLDGWLEKAREIIDENPEFEGIRGNFYSFTQDHNSLDTKQPTESRVSLFKYTPDLQYSKELHEWPIRTSVGQPAYGNPFDDKKLGIFYLSSPFQYLHYSWSDPVRCFQKAKNYTKVYVKQGTETQEHLDTMTPTKDSWWWDKKSDIKYKGKLPSVFLKYGLLEGQENPEEVDQKPKISVYTIIKNAIKFDYPIIEAIRSTLPFADEVIVNLGDSEDGTKGLVHKAFDGFEKVKMFDSVWEGKDAGTSFLRSQSNAAKDKCRNEICLYLQADEIYSEEDYDKILSAAQTLSERKDLVGAIFKWKHFDGDFGSLNPDSYPAEVRLIRKNMLESIGDAQSMGILGSGGQNAMVWKNMLLETNVRVFHIGWSREPKKMLDKLMDFDSYYHEKSWVENQYKDKDTKHPNGCYNYGSRDRHIENQDNLPFVLYPRVKRFEEKYKDIVKYKGKFNAS